MRNNLNRIPMRIGYVCVGRKLYNDKCQIVGITNSRHKFVEGKLAHSLSCCGVWFVVLCEMCIRMYI